MFSRFLEHFDHQVMLRRTFLVSLVHVVGNGGPVLNPEILLGEVLASSVEEPTGIVGVFLHKVEVVATRTFHAELSVEVACG